MATEPLCAIKYAVEAVADVHALRAWYQNVKSMCVDLFSDHSLTPEAESSISG